jgi:hypothetical protein
VTYGVVEEKYSATVSKEFGQETNKFHPAGSDVFFSGTFRGAPENNHSNTGNASAKLDRISTEETGLNFRHKTINQMCKFGSGVNSKVTSRNNRYTANDSDAKSPREIPGCSTGRTYGSGTGNNNNFNKPSERFGGLNLDMNLINGDQSVQKKILRTSIEVPAYFEQSESELKNSYESRLNSSLNQSIVTLDTPVMTALTSIQFKIGELTKLMSTNTVRDSSIQ